MKTAMDGIEFLKGANNGEMPRRIIVQMGVIKCRAYAPIVRNGNVYFRRTVLLTKASLKNSVVVFDR